MELVAGLIVAAIVGAVATWTSTRSANEQSQINQANQNTFNAEQARIAREWDAPANQMQRFIDAGINPSMAANAITGQSTHASPVAQSGQGAPVFPFDASALTKLTSQFNELSTANNTNKNTDWIDTLNDAKQKEILQRIEESIAKQNLDETLAGYYITSAREMVRMNNQQLQNLQSENNKVIASIELIDAQTRNTNKATDVLDKDIEVKDTEIASMQSDIAKNESDIAKNESDITRNDKLNEVSNADIVEKLTAAGLNRAATILKNKEIDLYDVKIQREIAQSIIDDYKAQLAERGLFADTSVWNNIMFALFDGRPMDGKSIFDRLKKFIEMFTDMTRPILNGITDMNSEKSNEWMTNSEYYNFPKKENINPNVR